MCCTTLEQASERVSEQGCHMLLNNELSIFISLVTHEPNRDWDEKEKFQEISTFLKNELVFGAPELLDQPVMDGSLYHSMCVLKRV